MARTIVKRLAAFDIESAYQEYDEGITEVKRKRFKKLVKETMAVKYWGFVAIIGGYRVKVIARQIGNGQKHFWSVIPAWRINYYRDIKLISKAVGDLVDD